MNPYAQDALIEPMLEHRIRLRAYDLYVQGGWSSGHAVEDWLKAEREVLRELQDLRLQASEQVMLSCGRGLLPQDLPGWISGLEREEFFSGLGQKLGRGVRDDPSPETSSRFWLAPRPYYEVTHIGRWLNPGQ